MTVLAFWKGRVMKAVLILASMLLMTYSQLTWAGVDSSGGGGGGRFQLSSGFAPGKLSASVFSPEDGELATVLKYFALVSNVNQSPAGRFYEIPQVGSLFVSSATEKPESQNYLQLGFELKFEDLYSVTNRAIEFRGALAEKLYQAMELGEAPSCGTTLDQNRQPFGKMLCDQSLYCQKGPAGGLRGGTFCAIRMSK
jgi:hypothetical protein